MKKSAQITINVLLAVFFITVAAHAFSKVAWAASGNTQICTVGSSCTVGEFVYDDSYVALNSATCQITSRNPDGTLYLNAQAMTHASENDGWYYHSFTTPSTTGLYRTEVKCTIGSDVIALDKSFEVQASPTTPPSANDIAVATWGYSNRSLSTFGSLVTDIWNSATRVLTGSSLNSGSLATKSDVDDKVNAKTTEIKDEIKKIETSSTVHNTSVQNINTNVTNLQQSVEKIINTPVIETSTEEHLDLGAKLNETEGAVTELFVSTQYANSKAGLMKLKWNSFENTEVLDMVQELTRKLGGENDLSSSGSVFGNISFLKESWDWDSIEIIDSQVKAVRQVLISIQSDVESSGRSKATLAKVTVLVGLLNKLEDSIGDTSNKSSQKTLFSKLKEMRLLATALDKREADTKSLLSAWDTYHLGDKQKKLGILSREVVVINRIPSINKTLLSASPSLEKELKNKSYYVLGIITANKKLLARKTGLTLTNTWLELGSIVFKSLVTNPSTLISQKATVKYYLPEEVKKEDIIEVDEGLTVKYDTEKNQYYVSGEFLLAPSETQTVSVKTKDIWVISKEKIDSLRKQAEDLSLPLEKTSYFAQGVTIKSDIDVSLDKVLDLMKSNDTPEAKIRAYREAQIEMKAIAGKMDKLKELVTQAGSAGTLFGFVGGTQTLAVWGLILILVVGFVFLALYMKVLLKQEEKGVVKELASIKGKEKLSDAHEKETIVHKPTPKFKHVLQFAIILMLFGVGAGLVSGVALGKSVFVSNSSKIVAENTQSKKVLASTSSQVVAQEGVCVVKEKEDKVNQTVKIFVPSDGLVNVRSEPSLNSSVIIRLGQTSEFVALDRKDGWVNILIESEVEGESDEQGWVSEEFTQEESSLQSSNE